MTQTTAKLQPVAEPRVSRVRLSRDRIVSVVVFVVTGGVLAVAFSLTPAKEGIGTHHQLGLPPCGTLKLIGVPCATCGMTTAFSYAAHGNLVASFITQPAGAIGAVCTAVLWFVSLWTMLSGAGLTLLAKRLWTRRMAIGLIVVVIAAWVYKIGMYSEWF